MPKSKKSGTPDSTSPKSTSRITAKADEDYPVGDFVPDAYNYEEASGPQLSELEADVLSAVIEALYALRSQGAYEKAKALEAKYFPEDGVERTVGDQTTGSRNLVSGGNE